MNSYELIVLDLNLPDMEGLDILKALRARKDETPVMVLTAKDTVPDRVMGLDSGADDFVIKPFELDEVCARLRASEETRAVALSACVKQNLLIRQHNHYYCSEQGWNFLDNILEKFIAAA